MLERTYNATSAHSNKLRYCVQKTPFQCKIVSNLTLVFVPADGKMDSITNRWLTLQRKKESEKSEKRTGKSRAKTHVGSYVCTWMNSVYKCVQNMITNVSNVNRILIFPYFFCIVTNWTMHSYQAGSFFCIDFCSCCTISIRNFLPMIHLLSHWNEKEQNRAQAQNDN